MEATRGTVLGISIAACLLLSNFFIPSAAAQDGPPAEDSGVSSAMDSQGRTELEEIVVTARKVEERLQDVPISITAFSAEGLRKRNI
ncbi:MAG: TonB-dependent receptor, partial [Gammaproteobacteria bacterium]